MTDNSKTNIDLCGGAPPDESSINLLDYFQVLLKHKKMIFLVVLCTAVSAVIISLLLPNMYTATATILPPQERSTDLTALLSQGAGSLGSLASSFLGGGTTADLYVGILKSRTVADALIKKFNLKELYDKTHLEDVYDELADRSKIEVSRTNQIISVSVEDQDPVRASEMANTYIAELDRITRRINITQGHRKRVFLEKRLEKVKEDLAKAEQNLKEFQEKYKLVSLEDQAQVAIEGAAKIKGEIIAAQTELEVLKQFGTERQNEAIMLKSRIAELQKQLGMIEQGNPVKPFLKMNGSSSNFFIPFNELPALGMQLLRLTREAKIQEKVFELVTSQYELAKIEEARDVNTIQVLDNAVPPDKKSSPKRALIVLISTFLAFFMAALAAFFQEYLNNLKVQDSERYQELAAQLNIPGGLHFYYSKFIRSVRSMLKLEQ
ncbi:MAG: lipopolysaccharide biosynthesis protein [Deltaproteobacteria bacterium]|nr:lipopolysaccharide biosynthesis protein [Deltaproteobacteria bacterium]